MKRISCRGVLQYIRVSSLLGLHALFAILVLARVTGGRDWGWHLAFIPLFVFDALSICYWVAYLASYIRKWSESWDDDDFNSVFFPRQTLTPLVLIFYGVGIPVKIAAEILFVLHLRDPAGIRVFIPSVLLMLLFLEVGCVAMFYALWPIAKLYLHR